MNKGRLPLAITLSFLLSACVTTGEVADLQPGEEPPIESDEAGIWMQSKKFERSIKTAGHRLRDPQLETYVNEVMCRVAPDYCSDVRVYLLEVPNFNAFMSPNGFMAVWSGLLLRAENEAQLAFILGHEVGHFLRRHSIQRLRDRRNKLDALAFFQIATAGVGVGIVGSIAAIATYGTILSFSRDNEREADDIGFDLAVAAGYDPREAAKIWQYLIKERDATEKKEQSVFFATHPAPEERVETLAKAAEASQAQGEVAAQRFLENTERFRDGWLRDELRKDVTDQTQVLLDHLAEQGRNLGQIHYYQGELARMSDREDGERRAAEAYEMALAAGDAPGITHRALGLVHWNLGNLGRARQAFRDYLAAEPNADDREIIKSYILELEGKLS